VIVWSRPVVAPPGTPFCAVLEVGASVRTACGGRWEPSYEDEIRWRVAHTERCGGCVRVLQAVTLLPCPFCGREPSRINRPSTHTATGEFHAISCFCGGCSTRAWQGGDSAAEVERLWNTRGAHRDLKPDNVIQPAAPDDASDPTWDGEGPRLARQRLERRER
jgi:hypothetical protein